MLRVFRDYSLLLVSNQLTMGVNEELLAPLGFGRIKTTSDDQKVIGLIKKVKPNLVVAGRSLGVFTGAQLLTAVRNEKGLEKVPFLIIGDKEDTKPGHLGDQVKKVGLADFLALPATKEQVDQKVTTLLLPLIDPDQEEAYRLMDQGADQVKAGRIQEAVESYAQAVKLYGSHQGAWLKLASLQADLDEDDEAETSFFRALRLNNYSLEAYLGLAELYERRQDFEQTVGILGQALGVAKLLKMSSKSVSRINFFLGEFQLRLKRLTGAEEAFDAAIEQDPEDANLRADIGDAYSSKGYFEESENHYLSALEIDPNLAHVFNRLGIAYRRQQKYEKALALYENARMHHPEDENLLFNIARAHFEASRPRDAEIFLEEALLMSPDFKEANFLISKLRAITLREVEKCNLGDGKEPEPETVTE